MEMYDSLSVDYDRFVNWTNRLAFELPFIESQLRAASPTGRPLRVLDAACATGMHAIELARRGYSAAGADLSAGMIQMAAANAKAAGVQVNFQNAGFGELRRWFTDFDAVLCLGNSLPHILTSDGLAAALADFAACLRPGGLALIQNRNFDAVMARGERWMAPEAHREGDREWLFFRFYDFDPDGLLTFHVVTLAHTEGQPWVQKIDSTRLFPQRRDVLIAALQSAGFGQIVEYGGMSGDPFDPQTSGNLVIAARRTS